MAQSKRKVSASRRPSVPATTGSNAVGDTARCRAHDSQTSCVVLCGNKPQETGRRHTSLGPLLGDLDETPSGCLALQVGRKRLHPLR
eukprot:297795-Hanusia_phi.AAC.1